MTERKTLQAAALVQCHVSATETTLTVKLADGSEAVLAVPKGLDAEIAHIMADGLQVRSDGAFDPEAGHLLVAGALQPVALEQKLSAQGVREKFVLRASSEGSTAITFRLSEEGVRKWIDETERMLAQHEKKRRLSS